MEIFVWCAFIGFTFLKSYLKRISTALRPENCEKCTGVLKEKNVKQIWYKGIECDLLQYKYTYKINCAEYELAFECRLSAKRDEDTDKYELPEIIEILYNENYPKRAYSHDVKTWYNPMRDKFFMIIFDFARICCIISSVYCIFELMRL